MVELDLPRRLSNKVGHRDYHPAFLRVGVRIDGQERHDVTWYDMDRGQYRQRGDDDRAPPRQATTIDPYWRFAESRQQRRARERWEEAHA